MDQTFRCSFLLLSARKSETNQRWRRCKKKQTFCERRLTATDAADAGERGFARIMREKKRKGIAAAAKPLFGSRQNDAMLSVLLMVLFASALFSAVVKFIFGPKFHQNLSPERQTRTWTRRNEAKQNTSLQNDGRSTGSHCQRRKLKWKTQMESSKRKLKEKTQTEKLKRKTQVVHIETRG